VRDNPDLRLLLLPVRLRGPMPMRGEQRLCNRNLRSDL